MAPSVVLVTGVSRFLGGHLAARLAADPSIERVIGVDTVPPGPDLRSRMGRAEFIRADIRNPLIAKVIAARGRGHGGARRASHPTLGERGGRRRKEMNVLGTMQLLAACQKAPTVRRVVLESTTAVYGASPLDPALFDETMTPNDLPTAGYARDATEIEGYLRGFARRRADVSITVLRFASLVGPRIDTVVTRYFALPGGAHGARAMTPGCSCCTRKTPSPSSNARWRTTLPRRGQRGRGRRAPALAGHPPGRAGAAAGAAARRRVGRAGARRPPGSRRSPRSSCACSTSAGSSTPPGCAPRSASRRAGPPSQAFDDFVRGRALHPLAGRERVEEAERLVDRGVHAAARLVAGLGRRA